MFKRLEIVAAGLRPLLRNQREFALENVVLRQQLAVLKHRHARLHLSDVDQLFWVRIERLIGVAGVPSHRSAGDRCPLASPSVPVLLALEAPGTRAAKDRPRDPRSNPAHVSGQAAVGRAADPLRAVEARDQGLRGHRLELHGEALWTALADLAGVSR